APERSRGSGGRDRGQADPRGADRREAPQTGRQLPGRGGTGQVISAVLARRYARALLELSKKRDDLEKTHKDLESISRVFERDPRVRRFFEAPNIARTEKEAFLQKQFKSKTNPNVYGLLVLLLRRRRFDHLVAIAGEFHKLAEEAQGITRAVVRTAVPITDGQADVLTRALGKRTGSKKVLLTR